MDITLRDKAILSGYMVKLSQRLDKTSKKK